MLSVQSLYFSVLCLSPVLTQGLCSFSSPPKAGSVPEVRRREGEGSGGTSGGWHCLRPGWVTPPRLDAASRVTKGANCFTLCLELSLNNTITGGNLIPGGGRVLSSLHPPALKGSGPGRGAFRPR